MKYNILKAALMVAPTNDVRYYLNGVHVVRDAGAVRISATDGHIMFTAKDTSAEVLGMFQEDFEGILDKHTLSTVLKMYSKGDEVPFTVNGRIVSIEGFGIPIIDGNFPDVRRPLHNLDSNRGTETGLSFPLLERVAKTARTAMGRAKYPFGLMRCGNGTSVVTFTFHIPDVQVTIAQAPARLEGAK